MVASVEGRSRCALSANNTSATGLRLRLQNLTINIGLPAPHTEQNDTLLILTGTNNGNDHYLVCPSAKATMGFTVGRYLQDMHLVARHAGCVTPEGAAVAAGVAWSATASSSSCAKVCSMVGEAREGAAAAVPV